MSDLIWLSRRQMRRIKLQFPQSHGMQRGSRRIDTCQRMTVAEGVPSSERELLKVRLRMSDAVRRQPRQMQHEVASGSHAPERKGCLSMCPTPMLQTSCFAEQSQETFHAPGRPPETRSSERLQEGVPGRIAKADDTRHRLLAADGGTRSVSGRMSRPIPPPASAASCRRRVPMRFGAGPSNC